VTTANDPNSRIQQGVYGVLGHRIAYSQSPLIFRRVFDTLQWPAVYAQFDRAPRQLRQFVAAASDVGIVGFNVTQPYKIRIIEHLNACDRSARAVGAVNAVTVTGNRLIGSNTDAAGVKAALLPYRSALRNASVVILGAGGASRAVAYALNHHFRVRAITVAARSVAKGRLLIRGLQHSTRLQCEMRVCHLGTADLRTALGDAGMLVNATPVGGSAMAGKNPLPKGVSLQRTTIVFDLIYRPRLTLLLAQAREAECRTVDGWPMLVGQAEASFLLWTGLRFPSKVRRDLLSL
jgi:shikimate dehydrogenase